MIDLNRESVILPAKLDGLLLTYPWFRAGCPLAKLTRSDHRRSHRELGSFDNTWATGFRRTMVLSGIEDREPTLPSPRTFPGP